MQPDHNNLVLTCYYCSAPKVRQQVNPASNWLGINFSSSRILVPNHILRCIDTKWLIKPIRVELELPWYRDSSGEHTFSVRVCCQLAHLSALCPDNTWMYINSPPPPLKLQMSKYSTNLSIEQACWPQRPDECTCESQTSVFASACMPIAVHLACMFVHNTDVIVY